MGELLSFVNGFVLGMIFGQFHPPGRLPIGLLLAISWGALATIFGLLFQVGPSVFLIDVPIVVFASVLGLLFARRFALSRRLR
jgi:hypothetical protein